MKRSGHRRCMRLKRPAAACCLAALLLCAACRDSPQGTSAKKSPSPPHEGRATGKHLIDRFRWSSPLGRVTDLQFSPQGDRLLVAAAVDNRKPMQRVFLFDLEEPRELYRFDALFPRALCFSADGTRLAVLAADELSLHDLDSRRVVLRIDRHQVPREIQAVGLTEDNSVLVAAGVFSELRIAWDASTGEAAAYPSGPIVWNGGGLSRDGALWCGGGWPGPTPRIVKADGSGGLTYCFRTPWPVAAKFTPDTQNVATIHEDGVLVLWELKPGWQNARQLLVARGYDGCIDLAISPDRRWIATATQDGKVRIRALPRVRKAPALRRDKATAAGRRKRQPWSLATNVSLRRASRRHRIPVVAPIDRFAGRPHTIRRRLRTFVGQTGKSLLSPAGAN